nr:hypothetical protein [Tanacetum cinerariifolium]
SKVSETITSVPKIESNASKTSKDSLERPKTVRSSAPLIEEWESDNEDENVFKPREVKKTVKPSLKNIECVNARNITIENENKAEKPRKFSQSPRGNKRNWNGLMTQKLRDGFEFKKKASFSKVSETITSVPKIESNASKTSKDSLERPKTVRSSAPLIEEWESDNEDENVFKPKEVKKTVKPSLKNIECVNARNITIENENKAEKPRKFSQSPRGNKRNWNGLMTQKLRDGFEFKKKASF